MYLLPCYPFSGNGVVMSHPQLVIPIAPITWPRLRQSSSMATQPLDKEVATTTTLVQQTLQGPERARRCSISVTCFACLGAVLQFANPSTLAPLMLKRAHLLWSPGSFTSSPTTAKFGKGQHHAASNMRVMFVSAQSRSFEQHGCNNDQGITHLHSSMLQPHGHLTCLYVLCLHCKP